MNPDILLSPLNREPYRDTHIRHNRVVSMHIRPIGHIDTGPTNTTYIQVRCSVCSSVRCSACCSVTRLLRPHIQPIIHIDVGPTNTTYQHSATESLSLSDRDSEKACQSPLSQHENCSMRVERDTLSEAVVSLRTVVTFETWLISRTEFSSLSCSVH